MALQRREMFYWLSRGLQGFFLKAIRAKLGRGKKKGFLWEASWRGKEVDREMELLVGVLQNILQNKLRRQRQERKRQQ